jgi:hypothetical protein
MPCSTSSDRTSAVVVEYAGNVTVETSSSSISRSVRTGLGFALQSHDSPRVPSESVAILKPKLIPSISRRSTLTARSRA